MAAFLVMGASAHVVFEHELHGLHGERGHPALALGGMGYRWPIISRMKHFLWDRTKVAQAKFMGKLLNQDQGFGFNLVLMFSLPIRAGSQIPCSSSVCVFVCLFDPREQEKLFVTMASTQILIFLYRSIVDSWYYISFKCTSDLVFFMDYTPL